MATPHVAGAAALVKAADPSATAAGIKALLMSSADPIAALSGKTVSGARLNVGDAVLCDSQPQLAVNEPAPAFVAGLGTALEISLVGTNCAHPAGATVTATADGAPIALDAGGDGGYTATVTPHELGALDLVFEVTVGAVSVARTITGSVVENYRFEDTGYAWQDASAGGKKLALAVDDGWVAVNLPFSFEYYDNSYTSVRVSSNGYLVFGGDSASAYENVGFPNPGTPNNVVACYWDDLNPAALGAGIWTKQVGSDFVIEWKAVPLYYVSEPVTFEVVLKPNGDIVCQYQQVMVGVGEFDHGYSASVGGENAAGAIGYEVGYDEPVLSNGQAILFTKGAPAPTDADRRPHPQG